MEPVSELDGLGAGVISAKMAKAMASPTRVQIMVDLAQGPLSPSQFVDKRGGDISTVARYFRQLAAWGYLKVIETHRGGKRRGGVEHVYQRIQQPLITAESWSPLPLFLREDISNNILTTYFKAVSDAIDAGTMDQEIDRHLSWDVANLDRQAWEELGKRLDEVLYLFPKLEAESSKRMAKSGEEPIPTTLGLASFRSSNIHQPRSKRSPEDR